MLIIVGFVIRTKRGGGVAYKRQSARRLQTNRIRFPQILGRCRCGLACVWCILASTINPLRLYATVAYLYRCIEVRSNALLAMPWSIYRGDTELVRHDVDEWPKELAAYQGLEELLWQTEAALCLKAESFWYKRRSRLGPIAVRWLDPTTMSPVWGAGSNHVV